MSAYVFSSNCISREIGIGHPKLGYLRVTLQSFTRWQQNSEWYIGWGLQPTCDNMSCSWMRRVWRPFRFCGELIGWRFYRMVAYHLQFGPLWLSYVVDRDGYGPIGPVWPRDARKRKTAASA